MTLDEIEATLPWGLHDAYLERLEIDWVSSTVSLRVRLMMTKSQDQDQRATITVRGVAFCAIDPPDPKWPDESVPGEGLWLDAGSGAANDHAKTRLPATPDGCFLHWLYVRAWNSFVHIAGREADLEWLEPHPVAARSGTEALFPGDEI